MSTTATTIKGQMTQMVQTMKIKAATPPMIDHSADLGPEADDEDDAGR